MSEETLLLVDGSGFLYRAFHALPDLRNAQGEPTGAIYGMVAMLRRLRNDGKLTGNAAWGAVVFDAPGRTFRDDWYPEYKANRKEMPDDLTRQIDPIHEIVRALGIAIVGHDGYEADDVIGTLARQAHERGMKTVVATGDKDLAQLVDDDVVLVNTMTRDSAPVEPLDRAGVVEKFGVPPERIVDWLTLVGDTVDNVPGVPKVGPKTAAKWLAQYGSLEAVIENAGSIGGVVGAAFYWLPPRFEPATLAFVAAVLLPGLYYLFRFGEIASAAARMAFTTTGIVYTGLGFAFLALIKRDFADGGD
ncbi:MAG: 5'-3' exonuclease H3TH domain-containing protein, partial [Gammaproteobacteria bacterium]